MAKSKEYLDWERAVHYYENNPHSQKLLDKNRQKRIGQVAIVWTWLQAGLRVTDENARKWKVRDLGRRICDLGEMFGKYIDREYALDRDEEQTDSYVYFLPENRGIFIRRKWILARKWRWWYSNKFTDAKIIRAIELEKRKREAQRNESNKNK